MEVILKQPTHWKGWPRYGTGPMVPAVACLPACLIEVFGAFIGRRIDLFRDRYVVGREPTAEILIDNISISRRHAVIEQVLSGYSVRDLGSTNGTFLNDIRVLSSQSLVNGDRLRFGYTMFKIIFDFKLDDAVSRERERLLHIDCATQVFNRETFITEAGRRITYLGGIQTVIVAGVDNYKTLSEQYHHEVVDHLLRAVADGLKHIVPRSALLARVGEACFGVYLRGADLEGAREIAHLMWQQIAGTRFFLNACPVVVNLSVGVSTVREGASIHDVLAAAISHLPRHLIGLK